MKQNELTKRNLKFLLLSNTWAFFIGFGCYAILRRNLWGLNLIWSTIVMIIIHLIVSMITTAIEWGRRKDGYDAAVNAALALGIYCVLSYFDIKGKLIVILLFIAAIVIAARITDLTMRYRKAQDKRIAKHKMITDCKVTLSAALIVIMLFCGYTRLFGPALMYSAPHSVVDPEQSFENAVRSNVSTIQKLQSNKWKELSVKERLDVLQCISDLESISLGISNCSIKVGVGDPGKNTYGYYAHEQNVIVIDSDLLLHGDPSDLCNTVSHETYHCYQHQVAELYAKSDSKYQSLRIFQGVSQYAYEINNYNDGDKDFLGYYSQELESDARRFGLQNEYYFIRIAESGYVPTAIT